MARSSVQFDALIIGAGVVGLSLAWRLAQRGADVCVVDRDEPGRGASWAGAGMIPAGANAAAFGDATAVERLAGWSDRLHQQWRGQLLEQTGVDNGYRRCGAIYLASDDATRASLKLQWSRWLALSIEHQALTADDLANLEPSLASTAAENNDAWFVSGEAQIRNPRHVRALLAACRAAGVTIFPHNPVRRFDAHTPAATVAITDQGPIAADRFCITSGCWSAGLTEALGVELAVRPVRGQIALLNGPPGLVQRNINVGPRYLVAREDGRILVGSTEEDADFDASTTANGIGQLLSFATRLAPDLGDLPLERSWAGLRPATVDGLPYIGRLPNFDNIWVAAGHFRAGLQLSPATAEVMAELMTGEQPTIDINELSPDRAIAAERK